MGSGALSSRRAPPIAAGIRGESVGGAGSTWANTTRAGSVSLRIVAARSDGSSDMGAGSGSGGRASGAGCFLPLDRGFRSSVS